MELHDSGQPSFVEFLSIEERNLLASMVNMRVEFDLFYNLDLVFRKPLARLKADPDDAVIPTLYFFVHYHLFTTVACMLRVHLAEALASTRKAIDACLTAYWLITNPSETAAYVNGEKAFRNIKARVKRAQKESSGAYPLAKGLVGLHELFSRFGSHADYSGFAHRLNFIRHKDGSSRIEFDYFHKPKSADEFRYYFHSIIHAYLQMFRIFGLYFDTQLNVLDPECENRIKELDRILVARIQALRPPD